MIESLVLSAALREQLGQAGKAAFPRECCGLIEGVCDDHTALAHALHATPNLADQSDRFEIDPAIHIALLRRLRDSGRGIIGCYHSHPNGLAEPSPRDCEGAAEAGFLWLIAAREQVAADSHLACFVWTGSNFARVRLAFPRPHECGAEG